MNAWTGDGYTMATVKTTAIAPAVKAVRAATAPMTRIPAVTVRSA